MTPKDKDIIVIEHTLRDIFARNVIRKIDVTRANKLFGKWIVLTGYKPSDIIYEKQSVLDEEPNYKSRKQ
tara:strand:+ start:346 stop:555 length:210 start_codon:yes stop_codon:yes gene_type:complete